MRTNRFRKNPRVHTFYAPRVNCLPLPGEMKKFVDAFNAVIPVTKKFAMERNVAAEFNEAVRREKEVTNEPLQTG